MDVEIGGGMEKGVGRQTDTQIEDLSVRNRAHAAFPLWAAEPC